PVRPRAAGTPARDPIPNACSKHSHGAAALSSARPARRRDTTQGYRPAMAALIDAAAGIGGRALAAGTAAVAALRTAEKPLHPRGENWRARVERHGSARTTGVGWLDDTGVDDALVRPSASVGLPPH